jgi:hypothetical protein
MFFFFYAAFLGEVAVAASKVLSQQYVVSSSYRLLWIGFILTYLVSDLPCVVPTD